MAEPSILRSVKDLGGKKASDFPAREEPKDVLLCSPDYFDVVDVKNPHMEGQIGQVDRRLAEKQWKEVREAVVRAGHKVRLIPPAEGLEDMVFTANPVLPGRTPKGEKFVLLANMRHVSRRREVPHHEEWFRERSYGIAHLSNPDWMFEGQGDALWHPGRQLLWGGYGYRTVPEVYQEVSEVFSAAVVLVKLADPRFYHLDTCLSPLSENDALYFPGAFTPEGLDLIRALFPKATEVPEKEAAEGFALNGLVLGKKVILQKGNQKTNELLRKKGYEPVEVDTSEFIKSGGSVFCVKMLVYGK